MQFRSSCIVVGEIAQRRASHYSIFDSDLARTHRNPGVTLWRHRVVGIRCLDTPLGVLVVVNWGTCQRLCALACVLVWSMLVVNVFRPWRFAMSANGDAVRCDMWAGHIKRIASGKLV